VNTVYPFAQTVTGIRRTTTTRDWADVVCNGPEAHLHANVESSLNYAHKCGRIGLSECPFVPSPLSELFQHASDPWP